jgi:hypothetical protein
MRYVYCHPKFGKATSVSAAEDARFIAAANVCDTQVVYTVGGVAQPARALYQASLVLPYGAAAKDAFDDLAQAMGGSWAFAGGELYVKAGAYTAPVMSLTDDDLAVVQRNGASESQKQISIAVHKERAQKFNTVKVKIWDQAQDFKQVDLTPLVGTALLTRDGVELVQEVTYAAIGYAPQALHVAGIMMRDARDPLTVELPFKLRAYPLELFDTVSLTLSRYGWAAKTFMILGRTWTPEGSLSLTLKETSAAITQMDSGFSPQGFAANTNLPKPWEIASVGTLTVTSGTTELIKQTDGTVQPRMRVTWAQVPDISVQQAGQIEVQYRLASSAGEWASLVVPGNETSVVTSTIQDFATYIIRARSKTKLAVSDWGVQVAHLVVGETVPPEAPTGTASGGMFKVRVTWAFGDNHTDIRGEEIWWAATNDRTAAARLSLEPYPSLAYDHVALSAGQGGYYWLRTVDVAGNASAWYPAPATGGMYATASADPSALLTQLTNSLGLAQLTADLATPITIIPIESAANAHNANNAAVAILQTALSDYDLTKRMLWQESVTNATITVDPVNGQISLLATANVTTDVSSRLTAVEVLANAENATLSSTVATLGTVAGNLTSTQSAVMLLQGQISSTASTVYVDNSVANATGVITTTSANAYTKLAAAELQSAIDAYTSGQAQQTLTGTVALATASIKTNADALAAQATNFSALVSTVAGNLAAIVTEQTTRATADTALATSITGLTTTVANNLATLTTEQTTRANADTANATAISTLSAQVNNVTTGLPQTRADLSTEYTTRANADTANATAISTLSAQVNNVTTGLPQTRADLSTEAGTRATADTANANSIATLSAQVNNVTTGLPQTRADLSTEAGTRATADTANATSISTLSARLDTGDYAAVKTSAVASASAITGLSAQYVLQVQTYTGGVLRAAGMQLASGSGGTAVIFLADKYVWSMETSPGSGIFTTPKNIMALGMVNGVATLGLDGDLIVDGSIHARTITAGSITTDKLIVGAATDINHGSFNFPGLFMAAGANYSGSSPAVILSMTPSISIINIYGQMDVWVVTTDAAAISAEIVIQVTNAAGYPYQVSGHSQPIGATVRHGLINIGGQRQFRVSVPIISRIDVTPNIPINLYYTLSFVFYDSAGAQRTVNALSALQGNLTFIVFENKV